MRNQLGVFLAVVSVPTLATAQRFRAEEATISEIHAAMAAGQLTCRELVGQYLARIAAYDKTGPAINAIVVVALPTLPMRDWSSRMARARQRQSRIVRPRLWWNGGVGYRGPSPVSSHWSRRQAASSPGNICAKLRQKCAHSGSRLVGPPKMRF